MLNQTLKYNFNLINFLYSIKRNNIVKLFKCLIIIKNIKIVNNCMYIKIWRNKKY